LRSMFRDCRLGRDGNIPEKINLPEMCNLSNERILYLRLSSPHEKRESIDSFLDKTLRKFAKNPYLAMRWNFACALQPGATKHGMPDLADTVTAFEALFQPERTRIAFLSPDRHGNYLQEGHQELVTRLTAIRSVEICWIDARDRTANGLLLADFFDFS
jgi:hypothetical protein